ncbi:MAG: hypothetical protein ABSF44_07870 [Candidatus Bathyarchaeia archaeon]
MHTLDSYYIRVFGTGEYIINLAPGEEATRAFQLEATSTSDLYASVYGFSPKGAFSIESLPVTIAVTGKAAEIVSMFAMSMPYTPMGKAVKIQAIVKGLKDSRDLDLEFYAQMPLKWPEELAKIEIKRISKDEEQRYSAELIPKEEGFYVIRAYLYDKDKRIDLKNDTIWAQK